MITGENVRLAHLVGREDGPRERSWQADDALRYALAVGAGWDDPCTELSLTTENTAGVTQQALPTLAVVLAEYGGPQQVLAGVVDLTRVLHAEQEFTLHRPLPVSGRMVVRRRITEVLDKGSGALVVAETVGADPDGRPLVTTRSSLFVRGAGGFGGPRGDTTAWHVPDREPDVVARFRTLPGQALLYRLTGDRNPLHSDPSCAARAGYDRPILHGMCTYGITCRLLVGALCGGDPTRVTGMSGRFTRPVFPGDELTVSAWGEGGTARFRTTGAAGALVLDRGTFTFR